MNILFTTFLATALSITPVQFLETKQPVVSKEAITQMQDIKTIKDKIENKVAQIRKTSNVIIAGTITKLEDPYIVVKNRKNEEKKIITDTAITKYFRIAGGSKQEVKKDELATGLYIFATEAQKTTDGVVSYEIVIDDPFVVKTGRIAEVNSANYYIKVEGYDKEVYIVDIEETTQRQKLDITTLQLETIGFSKMEEGDIVNFTYVTPHVAEKKTRMTATKILILPQL